MDTRRATQRDLDRIRRLLEESGLPALPPHVLLSNVAVALDGEETVGGVVLEVRGRSGLVRSVVVAPASRGKRVGASLVRSIIARGHELGLRDLYLLTEDAAGFFSTLGFVAIDRAEVPGEIRTTREFAELCPESATVMKLPLATRW